MANVNAPFGLRPTGLNGAPATPSFSLRTGQLASNNTGALYRGDPVIQGADGYWSAVSGTPVTDAASQYVGVFWGCEYLSVSQGRRVFSSYWPGGDNSGEIDVQVIPTNSMGVEQQFLIQALLTPVTRADIGLNGRFSYLAGTAYSGYSRSKVTLDTTLAATATFTVRIVGLYSQIAPPQQNGTDDTTDYNIVIVAFNAVQETGI